ncbi:cardiolipin synthase [Ramlibacter ginsenosidimutans]|uniref:Cardiolipin synthase n=1 Tax=Ramlibacter ginsenosidimutans TaxID=502333 RepID=A0A934TNV9_9BURK|nr:cardiolipin synthase [Ramlibacter ginsenosidimutans]MBK6004793.1 cardiolipin synthase [Ramlibacter ginsenosidimutans]
MTGPEAAILGAAYALLQAFGVLAAGRAVMEARTAQGAAAWAVALVAFPLLALPLFLVFGQSRFADYLAARRAALAEFRAMQQRMQAALRRRRLLTATRYTRDVPFERLAKLPFTGGNAATLLVDGAATFDSIFAGIAAARDYVLVQFYILRDDRIGRELLARLLERAAAGVRVHLLYDEVGSFRLPRAYVGALRAGGVEVHAFHAVGRGAGRLHLNFRNHRKIVIVDGRRAWVGGLNVGDEYLGRDPRIGPWRDTHLCIEGPAVQCVQVSFCEDWHWAAGRPLRLQWDPVEAAGGGHSVLCLPSGPADELETCTLFFIAAIGHARSRLWVASPYFVPDEQFVTALQLAALRGVDVRVLLPERSDNPLVGLSGWSYVEALEQAGVAMYRYQDGFMHQKVTLIDDDWCTVGTANFDNRSFRLNFELTMAVLDRRLAAQVRAMLQRDFGRARRMRASELRARPLWFRFAVRLARLSAPVQ